VLREASERPAPAPPAAVTTPPAPSPSVSVLIASFNNSGELVACLEALRRLDYPRDRVEIVVLDNGSTDGTSDRLRERFSAMETERWARLVLRRSERNLGAFGGRAAAAASLSPDTEFVLSLDDDVEIAPDALGHLIRAGGPGVGIVGARIVYWDAPDETASAAGDFDRRLGRFRARTPAARTACDFVSSCGLLVSRAAWDATGGFDGSWFTSHGDVDLCLRARRLGYAVQYEPAAVIRHRVARGGTRTPERVYYGYRNKLGLLRRHVPRRWRPLVWTLYAAGWLPRIVAGSVAHHGRLHPGELRAILLAVWDGLRNRQGRAPWFP
jgi:GT2 family glycosyltransferase